MPSTSTSAPFADRARVRARRRPAPVARTAWRRARPAAARPASLAAALTACSGACTTPRVTTSGVPTLDRGAHLLRRSAQRGGEHAELEPRRRARPRRDASSTAPRARPRRAATSSGSAQPLADRRPRHRGRPRRAATHRAPRSARPTSRARSSRGSHPCPSSRRATVGRASTDAARRAGTTDPTSSTSAPAIVRARAGSRSTMRSPATSGTGTSNRRRAKRRSPPRTRARVSVLA